MSSEELLPAVIGGSNGDLANTSFLYSDIGTLVTVVGPTGGRHQMNYDDGGRMTQSRNPDGVVTSYQYDARGNLSEIRYGDGSSKRYQYNNDNLCTSYTDEEGGRWQYEYDRYGYRSLIRDPLGHKTTLRYDEYGRLLSLIDPEGSKWQYEYDVRGRKAGEIDPLGFRRESVPEEREDTPALFHSAVWPQDILSNTFPGTIVFNALQLPSTITWPDGGDWHYRYSPGGRLISAEDPEGGITNFTYTPRGFLETTEYPDGSTETQGYDRRGLIISKQDAERTRFEYDAAGRLSLVENEAGVQTRYIRNRAGRVTEILEGLSSGTPYGLRHRRYHYDAAGNIIKIEEGQNNTTLFEYDKESRLISMTDPSGYVTRHRYADDSRESQDALGRKSLYYFDDNGRLTGHKNPLGHLTDYEYSNTTVSITTPLDAQWTGVYDPQGRLIEIQYPDGSVEKMDYNDRGGLNEKSIGSRRHRYEYDERGNLVREETEDGEEYVYDYDERNNRIREVHPGGYSIAYTYEGRQLLSTRDSLGNSFSYTYGNDGRLKTVTDGRGELIRVYGHDALGRLILAATPEVSTVFQWDRHNRLVSSWDSLSDMELRYSYDARGNLISLKDSSGFEHEMTYNEASETTGIFIAAVAGTEELRIHRDELGRPGRIEAGALTQTLRYNENGAQSLNMLSRNFSGRGIGDVLFAELYLYDGNSRRRYSIDEGAELSHYLYDADNQLSVLYNPYGRIPTERSTGPIQPRLRPFPNFGGIRNFRDSSAPIRSWRRKTSTMIESLFHNSPLIKGAMSAPGRMRTAGMS